MSEKYDGWIIKNTMHRTPFYLPWTFRTTRKEAIEEFEESWECDYSIRRRKGEVRVVKVKFVEVE